MLIGRDGLDLIEHLFVFKRTQRKAALIESRKRTNGVDPPLVVKLNLWAHAYALQMGLADAISYVREFSLVRDRVR
jgi:hypothetical protein